MKFNPLYIFLTLCGLFLFYSFQIYFTLLNRNAREVFDEKKALNGQLIWQKNNCQSCHQLYGLGGYLGPDLTNVYSNPKKGMNVIKAMVKTGVKQMPAFHLTDNELNDLTEFLKSVDASGKSDPRNFKKVGWGMAEKNEEH